ncbi:DNA-3-methyladenine glycosylase I [Candidatus Xianfuyuplasma coldseepsis]|uniref:DNA-3-methyladenine glycosylase I n=1 Tax=Candidatus Xianfuyuplasma coldseepsis TaxID=2782163 RepID=A0A7L7KT58_9MOLU|nr:DNA-3-methyladenine glycosylase I [Xianfuyuplasma coldseepsis]QMS85134.1 DNA-3-methyladenine glycosylase I [Xianfuyuplasma coldseepsis]
MNDGKTRCFGNKEGQELYAKYHDEEWGIPVHDDRVLFEFLILEGAQAGLNWYTVLKKREGYREAFKGFDPLLVSKMTDDELEALRENPNIIRNKLKIYSARKNAIAFLKIQEEYGSFDKFLWSYVDYKPIINHHTSFKTVPVTTPISDALSKELKKRGMTFVGSTIMYAYMQAIGMVDDHLESCHIRQQ